MTKKPKNVVLLQPSTNEEPLVFPRDIRRFQVSGFRRPWTHELILRGLSKNQLHHFIGQLHGQLSRSALQAVQLVKNPSDSAYEQFFLGQFTRVAVGFTPALMVYPVHWGKAELRLAQKAPSDEETIIDSVFYSEASGNPIDFLYARETDSQGVVTQWRSYRVNVHELRRGGFIGKHSRGYRRFHYSKMREVGVEDTNGRTVGPEMRITVETIPGLLHKANFTLTLETFSA